MAGGRLSGGQVAGLRRRVSHDGDLAPVAGAAGRMLVRERVEVVRRGDGLPGVDVLQLRSAEVDSLHAGDARGVHGCRDEEDEDGDRNVDDNDISTSAMAR